MVGSCKGKTHKLGTWHTQRVGPFTSVGGYDWHQISWVDPAFISTAFPAGGGTAGILGHFTGPVDADGTTAIGYPPIHQPAMNPRLAQHQPAITQQEGQPAITPQEGWHGTTG